MADKGKWSKSASTRANARSILSALFTGYLTSGRIIAEGSSSPEALHRFRIQGKRLRYTFEIFRSLYDDEGDRLLELLRGAQSRLGGFNDCVTMMEMLKCLPGDAADTAKTAQFLAERSASLRSDFEAFWKSEMDPAGAEEHWCQYLGRPLRRRV